MVAHRWLQGWVAVTLRVGGLAAALWSGSGDRSGGPGWVGGPATHLAGPGRQLALPCDVRVGDSNPLDRPRSRHRHRHRRPAKPRIL
ncbi:hypothetical protein L083_5226 [Actinoplanes sp. N902-109]|nr:hypothetical protein L083_5226 [Actinoplanes sp. N902-109]